MSSSLPVTGVRIRVATSADADCVVELAALVDFRRRAEEVPAALAPMRVALAAPGAGPLAQGMNHFLIAESGGGHAVGVVCCGPARWNLDREVPGYLRPGLARRVATVHALAVRPEFRRAGIARALLEQAEAAFRDAGYAALALRHERDLSRFYQHLGYTSANRLSMLLPTGDLLAIADRGWKHAFKVLDPRASVVTVQGWPTIAGVLPA